MKSYLCAYKNCQLKIGKKSTVKFARFVKPLTDLPRAIRWVYLVGRDDFKVKDIDKFTVICEKHFLPGVELDWRINKSLEPFPPPKSENFEPELKVTYNKSPKTYEGVKIVVFCPVKKKFGS